MAEVAGLVIGGVGLAAMFDATVNAFDRIETGKAYGKDYQEAALRLAALRLRLTRWRDTVKIVDDPAQEQNGIPVAPAEDAQYFEELLGSIARNFEDAEKAAKRHELKAGSAEQSLPSNGSKTMDELEKEVRGISLRRQKGSSVLQKVRWVFHDQKRFDKIIGSLTDQVTDVVELFPADKYQAQHKALVKYAQDDAEQLDKAVEVIKRSETEELEDARITLMNATELVDPQIKELLGKVAEKKTGHIYGKVTMRDSAQAQNGRYIDSSYRGLDPEKFSGTQNRYGDVDMSGSSRMHQGDKFGGSYILDN